MLEIYPVGPLTDNDQKIIIVFVLDLYETIRKVREEISLNYDEIALRAPYVVPHVVLNASGQLLGTERYFNGVSSNRSRWR